MEHAERRGARDRKQAAETRTFSITAKVAASRSRFFVTAHYENLGSFAKNGENGEVTGSRPAKSTKNGVYVL